MHTQTHHALLFVGTFDALWPEIQHILCVEDSSAQHACDILTHATETLLIDDAHDIFDQTRTRVPEDRRRIVILSFAQATTEAQNALLKLTEEPGERTQFVFVVPSESVLLPTLVSRLQRVTGTKNTDVSETADVFLQASFAQRAEMLSPYIDERQMHATLTLLHALETRLAENIPENRRALRALAQARDYALRRGASLKLVLEYVALTIPRRV